jgi:hypothetical protein
LSEYKAKVVLISRKIENLEPAAKLITMPVERRFLLPVMCVTIQVLKPQLPPLLNVLAK